MRPAKQRRSKPRGKQKYSLLLTALAHIACSLESQFFLLAFRSGTDFHHQLYLSGHGSHYARFNASRQKDRRAGSADLVHVKYYWDFLLLSLALTLFSISLACRRWSWRVGKVLDAKLFTSGFFPLLASFLNSS